MPLTEKGNTILTKMIQEYGKKKGEDVFYASENAGTIKGVAKEKKHDKKKKPPKKSILTTVRKKQGPGFWQADIGE